MDTGGKLASTSASDCVCSKSYYAQVISGGLSQCMPCPVGAYCGGNTSIQAEDGYWRSPNTYDFFECNDASACQNQTCVHGSTGPLCGACHSGYALVGSKCSVCPNLGLSWFLFLITAILVLTAVIILIWKNVNGERTERTIILKILINYLQTLSFIGGFESTWNFSKTISSLFQASSTSNFSVGIFTVHCAVQWDQYEKFSFYMIAPIICLFLIFVYFFIRYTIWERKSWRDFSGVGWGYTKTTCLVFLLFIHPTLTQQIFQMFNCTNFAGNKYLAVDLSLSCDTRQYKAYSAAAAAMIFVYVLGIPGLICYQLGVNRKKLNEPEVRAKLRFLYEGYTLFFWEVVIIVRKILLVAVVVFLRDDSFRSVWAGIWLLCIALFANVWARPYQRASLQLLESASLTVILASLLFGFLSIAPNFDHRQSEQTMVVFFVYFLNCTMTLILVVCLAYQYYKRLSQNKIFQKIVYKIIKVIKYTQAAGLRTGETTDDLAFELEMDNFTFTEEKYNVRPSEPITAEKLRRGRSDFRLTMAETPITDIVGDGGRDYEDENEEQQSTSSISTVKSTDKMLPPY